MSVSFNTACCLHIVVVTTGTQITAATWRNVHEHMQGVHRKMISKSHKSHDFSRLNSIFSPIACEKIQ